MLYNLFFWKVALRVDRFSARLSVSFGLPYTHLHLRLLALRMHIFKNKNSTNGEEASGHSL